jgi:hypothetical protein
MMRFKKLIFMVENFDAMLDLRISILIWIILSLCPKEITPKDNSSHVVHLALNAHQAISAKNFTDLNIPKDNSIKTHLLDMMLSFMLGKSTDMKLRSLDYNTI